VVALAEAMNSVTPTDLGPLDLEAVVAEGRVIVLKLSGLENWRPNVSDEVAAKMFASQMCDGPGMDALVAEGAQVRIDATTPSGEVLAPLIVCGR